MKNQVQELIEKGTVLPLMEAFYTVQGEGFHQGTAAYFIRLGGCDVGCHWCDVKESWDAQLHPPTAIETIVEAASFPSDVVVVTGGEPLMYNLDPLTGLLKKKGKRTHIETSGAHPLSGAWDWVCLSPKKRKLPQEEVYEAANELKVVVYNNDDFRFAREQAAKVSSDCRLFLQPEWSRQHEMKDRIVDFIKEHPEWKISLQTHKYLEIP